MFGIKFKKKTEPTSTPADTNARPDSATIPPVFSPPPSASTTPLVLSPTHSNTAPTDTLHRNGSNGSSQIHSKASFTSLNNYNYNNNLLNNTNHIQSLAIDGPDQSYKVPLEGGDNVKVPVSDPVAERARSNTFGYGHNNITNSNNGSNNTYMLPSTSNPITAISESERRNSQVPKINPATKPSAGAFTTATVTSIPISGLEPVTNTNSTAAVPASAASSATPSRSSSTSNRGYTGVSTGSFTPLSVTPPMTPHLTHESIADNNTVNGYDTVSGNGLGSLGSIEHSARQHSHGHQYMIPPIATTSSLGTFSISSTSSMATGQYQPSHLQQLDQTPVVYSPPPSGTIEDRSLSSMAFVSSPLSYQPPSNPLSIVHTSQQQHQQQQSLLQDIFQGQYMPAISEGGASIKTSSAMIGDTGNGSHISSSSSTTPVNTAKDTFLLQQQQYQQQQYQQFTASCNMYNPLLDSTTTLEAAPGAEGVMPTEFHASTTSTAPFSPTGDQQQQSISSQDKSSSTTGGGSSTMHGSVHGHTASGSMVGAGTSFSPNPVIRASTSLLTSTLITHDVRPFSEQSHIVDGSGPVVLMAIGKTGQGKSSLLNKIMGTSELKASASVRAVTKGIAERSGWGRFEDNRRVLVTVADTPGLADTEGDDEKNIPILKEYIKSVGTRLGVTAFLLVFKIDSGVDMIITILTTFNDIMKDFPNFWDNVVLVFTGCDYRRNVMNTKQLYHDKIQAQLKEHFFKDFNNNKQESQLPEPAVQLVFLSCAEAPCGFSLGEKCDCKARTAFLNAGIKRLWYAVRSKRRWVLDQDSEDDGIHS
ncbi:hypothetical protein BGZ46_006660 [Entomortierella lignicola]|nr:hypothetical protein BGZ46_006660 [Entomortierella lignicola]